MKKYQADDMVLIGEHQMFVIKRPDPYAPTKKSELPKKGDTVLIDGAEKVVVKSHFMGDSEFKYYPDIVIFCKT